MRKYKFKEALPDDKKLHLIEASISGKIKLVKELLTEYRINPEDLTGKMEQI